MFWPSQENAILKLTFSRFQNLATYAATFPLEIGSGDVSGGSVSYELGTSAYDTVELRDGTVLSGDLVAVSGMEVRVRVAGTMQSLDRNKVKRTLLTERDPAK